MEPTATPTVHPTFPPVLMGRIGFLLSMAKGGAEGLCAKALGPLDLHVKEYALLSVLMTEGPRSQQELADWVRMDRTTMVGIVDSMERKGHVVRERNPDDRRAYLLKPTARGERIQVKAEAAMRQADSELFASLTEAERRTLLEILGKIADDVGRPPGDHPPPR